MKRRELERRIARLAKEHDVTFERADGGRHDKFQLNGRTIMIPRHREIGEGLAATILKQARAALRPEEEEGDR